MRSSDGPPLAAFTYLTSAPHSGATGAIIDAINDELRRSGRADEQASIRSSGWTGPQAEFRDLVSRETARGRVSGRSAFPRAAHGRPRPRSIMLSRNRATNTARGSRATRSSSRNWRASGLPCPCCSARRRISGCARGRSARGRPASAAGHAPGRGRHRLAAVAATSVRDHQAQEGVPRGGGAPAYALFPDGP